MSSRRLQARLPAARPVGYASARGYEVIFHKRGFGDDSGKCGLIKSEQAGAVAHGVIYTLDSESKPKLDQIEGVGQGYDCIQLAVQHSRLGLVRCESYLATALDDSLQLFDWYLAHVMTGAREHSLPEEYLNSLSKLACLSDPDSDRRLRELAIYRD